MALVTPGNERHDHLGHLQLAREVDRVERPGAAEGDETELARVEAALDGHEPDRLDHVRVGDLEHALRRVFERSGRAARRSAPGRTRARASMSRLHAPVEEEVVAAVGRERGGHRCSSAPRRPCRSRPARDRRRRSAGRCAGSRPESSQAIEPPPAPIEIDVDTRKPDRHAPLEVEQRSSAAACPSRTTAMSALVPPMSRQTTFVPAGTRRRPRRAAMTPAAGPELSVLTATPLA